MSESKAGTAVNSEPTRVRAPIFLVGAERSGTTLLRLMLDSHPSITGCEGFEFLVEKMGDDGSVPPIEEYHDYLAVQAIFGSSGLVIDRSLDYPKLVNSFLQQRLDLSGKEEVSAMVHFHFGRLLHLWPDAKFIHLLRDPRDVARSVVQMGWEGTVFHGVGKWIDAETEWGRFASSLPADRFIEVGYADLIADHETQLRRISDFIGVPYTTEMLAYADDTDYDLPDPSRVARWPNTMSEREIRLVEHRVGSLLAERGFEPSGLPTLEPSKVLDVRLRLESRFKMWKQRIDKFGLRLFVERGLARFIPIPAYRRSVRLRFNAIERAGRKRSWREPGREYSVRDDDVR